MDSFRGGRSKAECQRTCAAEETHAVEGLTWGADQVKGLLWFYATGPIPVQAGVVNPAGAARFGSTLSKIGHVCEDGIHVVSRADGGWIIYGELDKLNRATGVCAHVTEGMIKTGTDACKDPVGFAGGAAGHARGHLLAKQLGGTGCDTRNLVTLIHNPANTPEMRRFENMIRDAVEAGQTVDVSIVPIYNGAETVPAGVTIVARGSDGFELTVTVLNRKPCVPSLPNLPKAKY